jgi:hypothetical protein
MGHAVPRPRRRLADRGFKQVDIAIGAADAELFRRIVQVLTVDDARAQRLRAFLRVGVPSRSAVTFQEWLAMLTDEEA